MPIIDGLQLARSLRAELKAQVEGLSPTPLLAVVLVGDDPESTRYVKLKQKAAEEIGARCRVHHLPGPSQDEIMELVDNLNRDSEVHGILVQLPLPPGMDQDRVINAIDVSKDVDGFGPQNLGLGFLGRQVYTSCAAGAILCLAEKYIPGSRPRVLLVGDSLDVIKPLTSLCVGQGYPVTVIPELEVGEDLSQYRLVVLEQGEPQSISGTMLASGSLVIDAGFHWRDGKTCGNAVTETFVGSDAPWLLPVPGGLGPLLITMLMKNLVQAATARG